jgi:hypothetical protein
VRFSGRFSKAGAFLFCFVAYRTKKGDFSGREGGISATLEAGHVVGWRVFFVFYQ